MNDYVTKKEFHEGLQKMKVEIIDEVTEKVTEKVTERVLSGVGTMFEHLDDKISAIAELLAPTMEKTTKNELDIEKLTTAVARHEVDIQDLKEKVV